MVLVVLSVKLKVSPFTAPVAVGTQLALPCGYGQGGLALPSGCR